MVSIPSRLTQQITEQRPFKADKMKAVFLISVIFTVALVHAGQGQPCTSLANRSAYDTFARRHIISNTFDMNSLEEWASYLRNNSLCGRTPTQSFIDGRAADVKRICSYSGRLVQDAPQSQRDFCMSPSNMVLYEVKSDTRCNVQNARRVQHNVIVRCARVRRGCRPIHFEAFRNQTPDKQHCTKPRSV